MSEETNKTIARYSITSDLKLIDFAEFIKRVPQKRLEKADQSEWAFNAQINSVFGRANDDDDASYYVRKISLLQKGSIEKQAKRDLFLQAQHDNTHWKKPIQEFYEDIYVKYTENFGPGDLIVKLGSRRYMMAYPEDFLIVKSDRGTALQVLAPIRTIINELRPITREEAMKAMEEYKREQINSN